MGNFMFFWFVLGGFVGFIIGLGANRLAIHASAKAMEEAMRMMKQGREMFETAKATYEKVSRDREVIERQNQIRHVLIGMIDDVLMRNLDKKDVKQVTAEMVQ